MPQSVDAVPRLTAVEQVAYAGWLAGMSARSARDAAPGALAAVGLADQAATRTARLSGGQLRRVGLAECLVRSAPYLLLDEPTAGLDPAQRRRFRSVLGELSTVGLIVSTHETHDIEGLFDRVVVLNAGRIVFDGVPEDFLRSASTNADSFEDAYAQLVGEN